MLESECQTPGKKAAEAGSNLIINVPWEARPKRRTRPNPKYAGPQWLKGPSRGGKQPVSA